MRNYELARRIPRAKQMEALCEALGVTSTALTRHYFGSPNQAMHYLFAMAGAANLTPENDQNAGPRLRNTGQHDRMGVRLFHGQAGRAERKAGDGKA